MKVSLTPIEAYRLDVNGRTVRMFIKVGALDGIEKLQSQDGLSLIVDMPKGLRNAFSVLLGTATEVEVMKLSPSLMALIEEAKAAPPIAPDPAVAPRSPWAVEKPQAQTSTTSSEVQ